MKIAYKYFLIACLMFFTTGICTAQEVEMADTMRSNGKIYVVVGIILIVLIGLVIYLFMLDRKISKLEEEIRKAS